MRQPRLKAPPHLPVAYYHCVSRVVNRDFVLGDAEREQFVKLLRVCEQFCGVRVVTHCVMSNHFHLLLEVPKRPEVLPTDEELLAKLKRTYSGLGFATIRQHLEMLRGAASPADAEAFRETFFARMWDVSAFMKALKQRFTQWFNRQRGRKGTLWEERYRSVLVEGAGEALAAMAAYIDLNPVRAGMVAESEDCRWCGYAEAVVGTCKKPGNLREIAGHRSLLVQLICLTSFPDDPCPPAPFCDGSQAGCFHVVKRIYERQFLLDRDAKDLLLKLVRAYEDVCGVEVLT